MFILLTVQQQTTINNCVNRTLSLVITPEAEKVHTDVDIV